MSRPHKPYRPAVMTRLIVGALAMFGCRLAHAQAGSEAAAAPVPETALEKQKQDEEAAAAIQQLAAWTETENVGKEELSLYGFADFTYSHSLESSETPYAYDSFAVGKFNLYFSSGLGANWRTLAEVRFTYLPNGADKLEGGSWARQDNTVGDYTDLDRPLRWGGIVIERVWLEYAAHPLFTVRAGHWLTPYGIWNVDHGSPAIIGVRRPYIVGEALFPTSQTGLELYGTYDFDRTQLGYFLTLSNGRGPLDTYEDLDDNKAVGARVYARNEADSVTSTFGVSFYTGRYTDRSSQYVTDDNGNLVLKRPVTLAYDELNWAMDLKVEAHGLLIQAEGILNEVVYDDSVRPPSYAAGASAPGFVPNYRRYGAYGLVGHRFDWLGVMPFAGFEYYRWGAASFAPASAAFWGGFNVRPTPQVVLKGQYTFAWFPQPLAGGIEGGHFNGLDFQAAWSF
jgi:hypothetical protein